MGNLKVIAVENPFMISFLPTVPVGACVYEDEKIYIYDQYGSKLVPRNYKEYIDTVDHAVKEGKYEWVDFEINEGEIISRDFDNNILIDSKPVDAFTRFDTENKSTISNLTLKLFNEFLKTTNKENKDMVEALKISFKDGFFRKEVEEIVKNDEINELSNLDKEIIVRSKIEGQKYIIKYVKNLLSSANYDKYIDINYFFRRLFNLEIYNYIEFDKIKEA